MGTSPDDYIPVSGSHKLFTVDTIYLVKFIQELFLSLNVDWKDKEAIRKFMTSEWLSTVTCSSCKPHQPTQKTPNGLNRGMTM